MIFTEAFIINLKAAGHTFLFISFLFLLAGSIILTIKTKFIQIRTIPYMFKLLFGNFFKKERRSSQTISANKALFTAMSTSIGIGNIVAPVVAIKLGGPGALLGFLLAAIFGGASTFTEVTLALNYRKKIREGKFAGGPMQYLEKGIHPIFGKIYAYTGLFLLIAWTSKQSNTLADLLQSHNISPYLTGLLLSLAVGFYLIGGIKKIGDLSTKLVPTMFILYTLSSFWIIISNLDKLPHVISMIFKSAFTTQVISGAGVAYGFQQAMRWGLANGFYSNEAGIGTATIPHSMATTQTPLDQGILSIVSVYTNGFLCLLSGLVVLLTNTWTEKSYGVGINAIIASFSQYFSFVGIIILTISATLFAFGTIIGNAYNGSQCFLYVSHNQKAKLYLFFMAIAVFIGTIFEVEHIWTITDFFVVPVAIPNIIGIVILSFKRKDLFKIKKN